MHIILDLLLLVAIILYSYLESLVKFFIPQRRKSVAGQVVLITGAGHGIGRLTAHEFAKRKSRLVLWDINKRGVEETAAECRKLGATVHVFVVDCSNRMEIYNSVDQVKKEVGDIEIVINNAGAIYPADLLSTKDEEITKTFEVNILGHFWIIKALLPSMLRRNSGHIVTVASVCGHGVIPYLIPYCSSKFAAVGFHRALTAELETLGKTGIRTSCLCPVFVNTGFTKNPSTRLWPVLETGEVARSLMDGILTNKKMIFVPSYIGISLVLEKHGVHPSNRNSNEDPELIQKSMIPKTDASKESCSPPVLSLSSPTYASCLKCLWKNQTTRREVNVVQGPHSSCSF